VDPNAELVVMDGKDQTLADYNVVEGSIIYVDQEE
jgi:hypothetical protein